MKHRHGRVYRSRSQTFGIVLTIFAYDVLMVTAITTETSKTNVVVYAVITMVIGTLLGARAALGAIIAFPEGIRVVNLFKTLQFPWGDIELFDIGQSGLLPQVCRIHTKDGKMSRAFGIQEMNVSLLRSRDKRPARKIV